MDLLLKVVEGPADGNWHGLRARFDPSGGLIGRAETARLSLPDSTRTVSRFHAHVSFSDDTYYLEEMGSRNAATINGKALKAGSREALREGDQVRIGHFTLAVDFDDPELPSAEAAAAWPPSMDDAEADQATRLVGVGATRYGTSNVSLIDALQEGVGVHLELPNGLQPEFMKSVGRLLRTLVGGLHRLASQRMRLREEDPPDKARPQSRNVDPARAAAEEGRLLADVLRPAVFGSARSLAKAQEMIDDLAARLAAMRTAVNAAIEQAEARLAPSAVEQQLKESMLLDDLLPMRRKARLWDLYRRTHSHAGANGKASSSAVRDAFNNAFSRAYEAEVSRLRKDRLNGS